MNVRDALGSLLAALLAAGAAAGRGVAPLPAGAAAVPAAAGDAAAPYLPAVPAGLPPVPLPADNPLTPARVRLGEKLFFEPALSADRSISCASCHRPERFFADESALSKGVGGKLGERNAISVLNSAFATHLLWDGRSLTLEDQVRYPVTHPLEMNNTQDKAVQALAAMPAYPPLFAQAFGDGAITWERLSQAVAAFERTLLTGNAPFDRYMAGDRRAISAAAQRGFELFGGRAGCVRCHQYSRERPFFTDYDFHNTGVGWGADVPDLGRYQVSKAREDKGAFRTPSLRNVARTAPYMHNGKLATLADVVAYYSRGGEQNPFLDDKIKPLELTAAEQADLVAFLESLTGETTYRAGAAAAAGR